MEKNDLEIIREQLRDKYDLQLSDDRTMLSGKTIRGTFQLTGECGEFMFVIEFSNRRRTLFSPIFGEKYYHCHPSSIEDAQECIVDFMEGMRRKYLI